MLELSCQLRLTALPLIDVTNRFVGAAGSVVALTTLQFREPTLFVTTS